MNTGPIAHSNGSGSGSTASLLRLPQRGRGRMSEFNAMLFEQERDEFCQRIIQINSTLDFKISARGWGYILEGKGMVTKADFDRLADLINDCRRSGQLPLDICADDKKRQANCLESVHDDDVSTQAEAIIYYVNNAHSNYRPFSFWEYQDNYVQMSVEKIDLKSLFTVVCQEFHVPIVNNAGWSDINSRAAMALRFKEKEEEGKQSVLLYCGDHDPAGLIISDFIRDNFEQISGATGWHPKNLIIDRFGLNYEFIKDNHLSWIDNLKTGKTKPPNDLADEDHPDHYKDYVQNYIATYRARKCEANALVIRPEAGRKLCRESICKYLDPEGIGKWDRDTRLKRAELKHEIARQLAEGESE
jgi:hypothetical protein